MPDFTTETEQEFLRTTTSEGHDEGRRDRRRKKEESETGVTKLKSSRKPRKPTPLTRKRTKLTGRQEKSSDRRDQVQGRCCRGRIPHNPDPCSPAAPPAERRP